MSANELRARTAPYMDLAAKAVAQWPPPTERQLKEIAEIIAGVSLIPAQRRQELRQEDASAAA